MTYPTYQAAKIANPDQDIKTDNLGNFFVSVGHTTCNPAEYCMTVNQFEDSGKKLVDGDLYINLDGNVIEYTEGYGLGVDRDPSMNKSRYVLKAKALEETKTYRYEKVADSIFDLKEEFERGELYFAWPEPGSNSVGYDKITEEKMLLCRYEEKRLLRRIEVTERKLFIEQGQSVTGLLDHVVLGWLFDAGCRFVNGKG